MEVNVFLAAVNIINIAMETSFLRRHADYSPSDVHICNLIQCVTDQNWEGKRSDGRNNGRRWGYEREEDTINNSAPSLETF